MYNMLKSSDYRLFLSFVSITVHVVAYSCLRKKKVFKNLVRIEKYINFAVVINNKIKKYSRCQLAQLFIILENLSIKNINQNPNDKKTESDDSSCYEQEIVKGIGSNFVNDGFRFTIISTRFSQGCRH